MTYIRQEMFSISWNYSVDLEGYIDRLAQYALCLPLVRIVLVDLTTW